MNSGSPRTQAWNNLTGEPSRASRADRFRRAEAKGSVPRTLPFHPGPIGHR